ncbi:helix-turn-helix transcriptional regulator [Streptomyces roseoverticillatus]|uniref:helix-turn-helix domain-containing protein n=1 Tax=Streptomyces roseoverticillatus TaxID=66429 RepID=UPI00316ABEFC
MTFGEEIKHARESRGWSQAKLAGELHFQQPYVSKVETGRQIASAQFAEQCDVVFGTPGIYARMRRRAADWGNPVWFIPYLELEREAEAICGYSTLFVMGLLQTPEYAEAVYRAAHPEESAVQIAQRVEGRMRRKELFADSNPPSLWVILHEAVLWSGVGGPDVMRGQLAHLVVAAESPHIDLQVFPAGAGTPPRGTPFIVLTRRDGSEVLYTDNYTWGQVEDSAEVVTKWRAAYEHLRADALPRDDSVSLIRHAMEAYTHENQRHPQRDMGEVQLQRRRRGVRRMGPRPRLVRPRSRPGQQEP